MQQVTRAGEAEDTGHYNFTGVLREALPIPKMYKGGLQVITPRKKVIVVPDLLQDYIVLADVVLVSLRYVKELMRQETKVTDHGRG